MSDVTILHNTACSTSRHALDEASAAGVETEVVHYLKNPLDRAELLELLDKLEDPPADLARKDGFFKAQGLNADDYVTPEAVADLLVEHPASDAAPCAGPRRSGHHRPPQGSRRRIPRRLRRLVG